MDYTTNYQLPIWAESDRILMEDFNDSYQKLEDALTEHGESLAGKGDCQIYTTSYVGTGHYGYTYPNSLTFPQKPRIFMINGGNGYLFYIYNSTFGLFFTGTWLSTTVDWSGNTVSWHNQESAAKQLNQSGNTYYVVALLSAAE